MQKRISSSKLLKNKSKDVKVVYIYEAESQVGIYRSVETPDLGKFWLYDPFLETSNGFQTLYIEFYEDYMSIDKF